MMGYKIFRALVSLDGQEFHPGSSVVVMEDNGDVCEAMVRTQYPDTREGVYQFSTEALKKAFP